MKYRRPLWVESSLSNFLALLAKAPARASVAPHLGGVLHISGGCLNAKTQERSEFRRTSPLQASSFLSPVSFGKTKEIGSPPRDKRITDCP